MRPTLVLLLAILTLTFAGCNTFDRRAREHAGVFNTLPPDTQARLKERVIHVGDTQDMVYIALGAPDKKQQSTTAAGQSSTWIYNRYWQEYRGEAYAGYRRIAVRNPKTGATTVYLEPIRRPVYTPREQPVMRVTFDNGLVAVVEQARDS